MSPDTPVQKKPTQRSLCIVLLRRCLITRKGDAKVPEIFGCDQRLQLLTVQKVGFL
jgi:hypothetical protein